MGKKKLLALIGSMCLVLVLASLPFMGACAKPAPAPAPTPAPTPTPVPAPVAEKYHWRMQTMQLPGTPFHKGDEVFIDLVQKMSNGQITIDLYPMGTIVPSDQIAKAVGEKVVEIGSTWDGYQLGMIPELELLEMCPQMVLTEFEERYTYYYHVGAVDMINESYAKYNVRWLGPHYSEHTNLISKVPIRTVDDFKGVKIRIAGSNAVFFEQFGAKTLYVPTGEIYTGLQLGTFDAVGWTGEAVMVRLGLHEVGKYIINPPYKTLSPACIVMNLEVWNSLPDHLKLVLDAAGKLHGYEALSFDAQANAKAIQQMKEGGIEFITLDRPEDLEAMHQAAMYVWNQIEAKSPRCAQASKMLKDFAKEKGYDWVK